MTLDRYEKWLVSQRDRYKLLEIKYRDKRTTRPWNIRSLAYQNCIEEYRKFKQANSEVISQGLVPALTT